VTIKELFSPEKFTNSLATFEMDHTAEIGVIRAMEQQPMSRQTLSLKKFTEGKVNS